MRIDTSSLATEGFFPKIGGIVTYAVAALGYLIDIQVVPQKDTGGGGGSRPTTWENADNALIIVRVKYKGKEWVEKREVSVLMGKSIEKVMATYRGFTLFSSKVYVAATNLAINIMKPLVKAFKRKE